MVQKEVKKKTSVYGIVAVLSAIVLISVVYAFGSPAVVPLPQSPNAPGTTQAPAQPQPTVGNTQTDTLSQNFGGMKTFTSLEELKSYLANHTQSSNYLGGNSFGASKSLAPVPSVTGTSGAEDYSTTNIQVAGVDEADTVKTDGQYLYISSTENSGVYISSGSQANNNVYIVSADPQNAKVISKIALDNNTMPVGLFISPDSSKLVVLASKNPLYSPGGFNPLIMSYYRDVYACIYVYDVSNKANPVLSRNFTVSGSYFNSRMIGNNLYAITSQSAMLYNDVVPVPAVYKAGVAYTASPTSIYYADMNQSDYYSFTSFYGINIMDDQQQPTNMTVLMSGASTMYVSPTNIYVTYPTWANSTELTSIYRVKINGLNLSFEAEGSVPGYTINQYAMDEYNGNLRIATNADPNSMVGWFGTSQNSKINNVYVLNQNLTVIGKLEGLAQGESLYAARFLGDKCYLVTFKQTDPFFVIDLSNPSAPKVAGELKIPGYSSYLQPYDENHVIGLGVENTITSGFESSNLKMSLFDVTDINNPTEIAKYTVEGNYTSSNALYDPKAFLFDVQKQLLVIPVSINNYYNNYSANTATGNVVPPAPQGSPSDTITTTTESWEGAYVFNLNLNSGFTLQGNVTHLNTTLMDSQGFLNDYSYWQNSQNNLITRSLYIGNTLYTISNSEVKLNSLTDLSQIAQVNLQ